MERAFERLQRILTLEAQQGYQDRSVIGGFRQFAAVWSSQAVEQLANDDDQFFIDQVAQELSNYHRLPGTEARTRVVDNLLKNLQNRPQPAVPVLQPKSEPKSSTVVPSTSPQPAKSNGRAEDDLSASVQYLKGVGPKIADLLGKVGATTVDDLLKLHPRRYDDYSKMAPINRLTYGDVVTVIGTVWTVRTRQTRTNKNTVHAVVGDGTGKVQVTWFNQPWLVDKIKAGSQIVVSGKVEQYLGRPTFNNPEWEPLSEDQLKTNRIVPVYPLTKGLGANRMRSIMQTAVKQYTPQLNDPLPDNIRKRRKLIELPTAVKHIHFPANHDMLQQAQKRLAFDEMFLLQLGMLGHRRQWQRRPALPLGAHQSELVQFFNAFPFEPTSAQRRCIGEITADLERNIPMTRLLQGDVGAGKTLVAAAAIVHAVKSGVQAALMAPTEILAEQHARGLTKLLEPLGVSIRLLTGSTPKAEKERVYMEAATGQADVFIGTTALIQPDVTFKNLGFVVIDEQHRFGVDQRGALRDKGMTQHHPHLLVMTATPIPRSLALSMYGDLELSIIDEMPPGRQEIATKWLRSSDRRKAYNFIRKQAGEGRQCYMIYPLVEESEKLEDVKAAVEEHDRLQREEFTDLRVGLLHGRMKSAEKDAVMRQFYAHELDVLVSTTVIEVGIDVPNSTVIVIEAANRFGLAQLHQLRGRVGRGQHKSYCILIADSASADSQERLKALEDTNDGFQLAEKDLDLRGPGEFFGRRQSGLPELQLASLFDFSLLRAAKEEAEKIFQSDPDLKKTAHRFLRESVQRFWENAGDVS